MDSITVLHDAKAVLGEGPLWSAEERAVYWVDIEGHRLLRFSLESGEGCEWPMPSAIGCVVLRRRGGLLVGLRDGVYAFDPETGQLDLLVELEADLPGNRLNDGKCDQEGRFLVGSMDAGQEDSTGCLYRIEKDLSVHCLDRAYQITNGPAFSPDGRTLYHNDSAKRCIYKYEYDPDTGEASLRQVFAKIAEGFPDGLCVDAAGDVWCAIWGGSRIDRFDAAGAVRDSLALPFTCPTSLTFGGDDLQTVFVTSARIALSESELRQQPLAGALIAVDLGVRGLPTCVFDG